MKIVIIGAGNLATKLARVLYEKISQDIHIHSKTEISAKRLADKLQCPFSFNINDIPFNANLYIISVNDSAISELNKDNVLNEKINNIIKTIP